MKANAKPEYWGQTHWKYGPLLPEVVYEVEELGDLFIPVKPETKAAKAAKEN